MRLSHDRRTGDEALAPNAGLALSPDACTWAEQRAALTCGILDVLARFVVA